MAKVEVVVKEQDTESERELAQETAHTLFLASIGAVMLAGETLADWINRLAQRGEQVQARTTRMVRETTGGRRQRAQKVKVGKKPQEQAEGELQSQVEEVLGRMDVPSQADVDHLSAQLAALSSKLDELKKAREKSGGTS